ncbi:hypothetical protein PTTG_28191 [Puccinia triticina 1-1 BBBD Race 1]|uniref:Uncharacterized protein n=1 Tax=Puccinia triticina (isolate 1-1 / race 1 (BBBD)) TaxID=630390 RepID=A0A180GDY9_PUCT1|nr:hypothetical protein PTTG_28191 [Puccinia triticina 1-1 BBBD Race 1]
MEESLAKFSSLGLKFPDKLIGCGIVGKITKKQPMLMQVLFADLKALAKPKEIIAKLRDIGRHKTATKRKFVEDPEPSATALATGPYQMPKKPGQQIIRCSGGKHNPKATLHTEETCWTIHLSTRPPERPLVDQGRPEKKQCTAYHTAADKDEEEAHHTSV